MSAEHVDRQPGKVEHEGGHQDVVSHGHDLAGDEHVGCLCEVYVLCRHVCGQKACMAEQLRGLKQLGKEDEAECQHNS